MSVLVGTLEDGLLQLAADHSDEGEPQMAVMMFNSQDTVRVRHDDDENGHWAYRILESGVLQVLTNGQEQKTWSISAEYAPAAWHKVQGTRFLKETERVPGADGFAPQPSPNAGRVLSV